MNTKCVQLNKEMARGVPRSARTALESNEASVRLDLVRGFSGLSTRLSVSLRRLCTSWWGNNSHFPSFNCLSLLLVKPRRVFFLFPPRGYKPPPPLP